MTSRRAIAGTEPPPAEPGVRRGIGSLRVMVAIDGSAAGAAAIRFGARLARLDPSVALTVVTVSPEDRPLLREANGSDGEAGAVRARDTVTSATRALAREGVRAEVRVVPRRESESVPDAISRHADRLRADLVVVGSEGRDTLGEWVVGGVALRLIYVATRPVVVVRAPRRRRA
jgi:nucleotide-binding universal stress UspA family protein